SVVAVAGTTNAEGKSQTDPEELIKYIEAKYTKAKEFESKIIGFETTIGRRPSFNVQPLSVEERENWHNYLDFIESDGDWSKVFHLYERCIVACARHVEAVMRHANMQHRMIGDSDGACSVYDDVIAKAMSIVVEALDHVKPSKELIDELLYLESILPLPRNIDQFKPLIENCINPSAAEMHNSSASSDEREYLSLIYIGFLHRFGYFASIINAEIQHTKLFLDPRISSELKSFVISTSIISGSINTWLRASNFASRSCTSTSVEHCLWPSLGIPTTYFLCTSSCSGLSNTHAGYNPSQTPTIPSYTQAPSGYIPLAQPCRPPQARYGYIHPQPQACWM
uniref:Uncharacterized protein n=2 Tax=Brassica oleracea TaxID=3712 RepID=A0A0D3CKH0_BRAOL